MHRPKIKSLRGAFVTGIIVLAPLAITVWVFNWLVGAIGGTFKDAVVGFLSYFMSTALLEEPRLELIWNILSTALVLSIITVLGYLSHYVATRLFLGQAERFVQRVPLIRAVYGTVKQIVETFSAQQRAVFDKVVLVPFPRQGSYAIGFLTNRAGGEVQARTAEEVWNVFIPTTPNPTSGFLIMVPRRDVIEMDMSIADGMKLIISGGAVMPVWPAPVVATADLPSPAPGEATPQPAADGTARAVLPTS
jgi:uncharacterized membrane protein